MMALLSPRVWAALVVAAALAFSHFSAYRSGKGTVRAEWDAVKVVQLAAAAKADAENRQIELIRQQTVAKAQNAQTERNKKLQTAAADARAVGAGLRDQLAAINSDLPGYTRDACRRYAATANAVLAELGLEAESLARQADGHASDALTLRDAWPK